MYLNNGFAFNLIHNIYNNAGLHIIIIFFFLSNWHVTFLKNNNHIYKPFTLSMHSHKKKSVPLFLAKSECQYFSTSSSCSSTNVWHYKGKKSHELIFFSTNSWQIRNSWQFYEVQYLIYIVILIQSY